MSEAMELSRFLGKPFRLFRFERQGLVWRFCTAASDQVVDGHTYLSAQIDRSAIKQTVERAKDKITIKVAYLRDPAAPEFPVTQSFGDNWHPYAPSDSIRVICMASHIGSLDPPDVEWMGIVTQPSFTDTDLTLTCEPGPSTPRSRNQGPKWQRGGCWKTVYSTGPRGCLLDPEAFAVAGEVTDVTGLSVTVAEFSSAPLPLAGGWLEWTRIDGLLERRSILSHSGAVVGLLYGAADLASGLAVTARPGCEGTWSACEARGNTINNGIAMYKPVRNPMEGSMSWG